MRLETEARQRAERKSGCPINLMLEVLGDKWSLIVIRDMIFGNRRHFRELLHKSEEGITSAILADRLKTLVEQKIITKAGDPTHKQKVKYSLTERGIELLPVLTRMAAWGWKYLPVSRHHAAGTRLLVEGGPKVLKRFMSELRAEHLAPPSRRRPVIAAMFWYRAKLWENAGSSKKEGLPSSDAVATDGSP